MGAAAVLVDNGDAACVERLMRSRLLNGPSYGVNKNVDEVLTGLWTHAGEHCLQASGGVGIGIADDLVSVGGEGELDASPVVRVRRAPH